jgi:DNA polymerase III delta subunit
MRQAMRRTTKNSKKFEFLRAQKNVAWSLYKRIIAEGEHVIAIADLLIEDARLKGEGVRAAMRNRDETIAAVASEQRAAWEEWSKVRDSIHAEIKSMHIGEA